MAGWFLEHSLALEPLGAEEKERTGLMLEQVNQSNRLPLDMPFGSCSLRLGSGNRGGKRQ